jgi:MYXO-CTERM domain-containing protein
MALSSASTMRSALLLLFLLLSASPAQADEPPPPDSPDAHCSREEQCKTGVLCPYASLRGRKPASGEMLVGEACRTDAKAKGLEQRCRHGGIYSGEELFCPPGATGIGKKGSSCACAAGGAELAHGGPSASIVLAAAATWRRRRRAPRSRWARARRRRAGDV